MRNYNCLKPVIPVKSSFCMFGLKQKYPFGKNDRMLLSFTETEEVPRR